MIPKTLWFIYSRFPGDKTWEPTGCVTGYRSRREALYDAKCMSKAGRLRIVRYDRREKRKKK